MRPWPSPRKHPLLSLAPPPCRRINEHVAIAEEPDAFVVFAHGIPMMRYLREDAEGERLAMAILADSRLATQAEVARACGREWVTVHRWIRQMRSGGVSALAAKPRGPQGPRGRTRASEGYVRRLSKRGISKREIARRVGLSEGTVRQILAVPAGAGAPRRGPKGTPAHAETSLARHEPVDRTVDRVFARLGLLKEAEPEFVAGRQVACAGALLVMPGLVAAGLFATAEETYGGLPPGFYGLKTTVSVVALLAVVREPRAEGLTRLPPEALGRLVGLDRVPEVKTLRRKLRVLGSARLAAEWMRAMAKRLARDQRRVLALLYVDGHARVYHGKAPIPKAHIAQMRLSLPAEVDTWVNARDGAPVLVWRGKPNAQLVSEMTTTMEEARKLVGGRRVTVVFDRGGWSPALFARMVSSGFDFLTYRKGRVRPVPGAKFERRRRRIEGRTIEYELADRGVYVPVGQEGRLHLRQVTRRTEGGHQTHILTSRWDLPAVEVAYRTFARWRQENFFKYMCQHFAIDALEEYGSEADDLSRSVPNPEKQRLKARRQGAREELAGLERAYGAAAVENREDRRPTMRGFKISQGQIGQAIRRVRERIARLGERLRELPSRVPLSEAKAPREAVRLRTERRRVTDVIRMAVYRAETSLCRAIEPHYARAQEEGRALLREAFESPGDIVPRPDQEELLIRLYPLSAPRRTRALAALCRVVNESRTKFPGTEWVLRFEVKEAP